MGVRTSTKTVVENPVQPVENSHRQVADVSRTDALWSIAFHANHLDSRRIPSEFATLRPIPLVVAIHALLGMAPSGIGAPVSRLQTWSFIRLCKAGYYSPLTEHSLDLQRALSALKIVVLPPSAPLSSAPCDIKEIDNCAIYKGAETTAIAKVSVGNRSLADLVVPMDPRNWTLAIGEPFLESWEIENDGKYPIQDEGVYKPVKTPAEPPEPFYLREVFKLPGLRLDTVLAVTFAPDLHQIELSYDLWESIAHFGGKPLGAIMVKNRGTANATVDPDDASRVVVQGSKTAKFSQSDPLGEVLSYVSTALLTLWQDAANNLGLCYQP